MNYIPVCARIAQLAEQRLCNPQVKGSNPFSGFFCMAQILINPGHIFAKNNNTERNRKV